MTTTITKWGNSHGIRIPKHILESLQLQESDTVELDVSENALHVKKKPESSVPKTVEELYEDFYGVDFETAIRENPYDLPLLDWGPPVGEEIW